MMTPSTIKRVKAILLFCLTLLGGHSEVFSQAVPLPIDPAVRIGKLENGLTYFIRRNRHPEGRAHFYIAQKVGSMQEEENQRGLAHFLEHIAFNGTKNFPGKSMINWLESIGVQFGSNLNAYTGFDETVYQLMDVPSKRQSTVDSCILILHDWSNAISLEDKEIDAERGVIEEEWRSRESGQMRVTTKMIADAFPGLKYGKRMPIGVMDIVRNFQYDELRDYYKKWYRPDLQGLIIVGDIDPVKVEATIKRLFANVPKPEDPAERVYEQVPNFEGVRASIATDKEAVGTALSINFLSDVPSAEIRGSHIGLVANYMRGVVAYVVEERFADIAKKPTAPFLSASANLGEFIIAKTKDAFNFSAVVADGKYEHALRVLVAEIERLRQYGITKGEMERAKKNSLMGLKKIYDERDKNRNGDYADEYASYFLKGGYISGIEVVYDLVQKVAGQLTVETFNQVLNSTLSSKDNIFISLTGPIKAGITYPTEEQFIQLFQEARKQRVDPPREEVSNTKLMEKAPKPGRIVKINKNGRFGSTVWTLSNGIQVVFKPTVYREDEIRFTAQRPGGLSAFDQKDGLELRALNSVINLGGLGQMNDGELDKALSGRMVSVEPSFGYSSDNISGSSTQADLETMMQLIYLNFTQKRSDNQAFEAFLEKSIASIKMREANPMSSVSDSIIAAMYPDYPEQLSLKEEEYKRLNYTRMMQMYKERMNNANGFKFVFVGNIDEKVFRPLILTYLASLPVAKQVKKDIPIAYPEVRKGPYTNYYTKAQESPMAYVANIFTGKLECNLRNSLMMSTLENILDQVYVESIREREGGTYGASINATISREPKDLAHLAISFQTNPNKAMRLNSIVLEELYGIAREGVRKDQFEKALANLEKRYEENLRENGYWLGILDAYYSYGEDWGSNYIDLLKGIKGEEVGALVKGLLDQRNIIQVMMLPEKAKKEVVTEEKEEE